MLYDWTLASLSDLKSYTLSLMHYVLATLTDSFPHTGPIQLLLLVPETIFAHILPWLSPSHQAELILTITSEDLSYLPLPSLC